MMARPVAPGSLLGANYEGDQQCSFLVWAPKAQKVHVHLLAPTERVVPMARLDRGYYQAHIEGIEPGATYRYRLNDNLERPDPASRFQSDGVYGASEIADSDFRWGDHGWFGLPWRDYIIYELHVGTFTPEGTFDAIIPQIGSLKELGITALELMPVAQFPGSRNWGYDGVFPFAVQNSYGGPEGLKRLVDACHRQGLAVILDVVYNHLGPEGNCFDDFAPYFTDRYRNPWGAALNFDGEYSDEVRRYFLENALYWQTEFHIDALRLDAVHAIKDSSALPFLQELARVTRRRAELLNRRFHLIAESDLNDPRVIASEPVGGWGLDAQWNDDFHHCLHVLLTGEGRGYYADFGGIQLFAKVFREGFAYIGQYSLFRKRRHGSRPRDYSTRQFVVCSQNHDQIGNRAQGERLSSLTSPEALKVAAGMVILSPFIPLLFMGEEYGETAPFQYAVSHSEPHLVEAVRQGRRAEFSNFGWKGPVPDPLAEATFQSCILNRDLRHADDFHGILYRFYCELIRLRKQTPAIAQADKDSVEVRAFESEQVLQLCYKAEEPVCILACFAKEAVSPVLQIPTGAWRRLFDSTAADWGGPGSSIPERITSTGQLKLNLNPISFAVFQQRA
jgi:maltooligosyltrehalose trehalohydrolase